MSSLHHAHASLDGLVLGDAFGDGWFTRSDEDAEELWAARELRPAPWSWTDDSAMAFVLFAHLVAHGEVQPGSLAGEFAAEYGRDPSRGTARPCTASSAASARARTGRRSPPGSSAGRGPTATAPRCGSPRWGLVPGRPEGRRRAGPAVRVDHPRASGGRRGGGGRGGGRRAGRCRCGSTGRPTRRVPAGGRLACTGERCPLRSAGRRELLRTDLGTARGVRAGLGHAHLRSGHRAVRPVVRGGPTRRSARGVVADRRRVGRPGHDLRDRRRCRRGPHRHGRHPVRLAGCVRARRSRPGAAGTRSRPTTRRRRLGSMVLPAYRP